MIALIDGDVLCYTCCDVRSRWKFKTGSNSEVVIPLDSEGNKIIPQFTVEEDRKFLESSWNRFNGILQNLLDVTYCTEYLLAVGGEDNFRRDLYPEYKANRKNSQLDIKRFVKVIKKLAKAEDLAIEATGREADDLLRIWAEESRRANREYVVCSIDKDLDCIPGKHYKIHKQQFVEISEIDAKRNYYEQLLKGDPTDNIPGIPGIGPVKASKLLSKCTADEEFQEVVVEQYMLVFDKEWKEYLLSNGKLIHIQRHSEDYFSFKDWPIVRELDEIHGQSSS